MYTFKKLAIILIAASALAIPLSSFCNWWAIPIISDEAQISTGPASAKFADAPIQTFSVNHFNTSDSPCYTSAQPIYQYLYKGASLGNGMQWAIQMSSGDSYCEFTSWSLDNVTSTKTGIYEFSVTTQHHVYKTSITNCGGLEFSSTDLDFNFDATGVNVIDTSDWKTVCFSPWQSVTII